MSLLAIGSGSEQFALGFREALPFYGDVFTDPGATSFQALTLKRWGFFDAIKRFFTNFASMRFARENSSKYPKSDMKGDGLQSGAVVIMMPGEVEPTWIWREADHPATSFVDVREIIEALDRALSSKGGVAPAE